MPKIIGTPTQMARRTRWSFRNKYITYPYKILKYMKTAYDLSFFVWKNIKTL